MLPLRHRRRNALYHPLIVPIYALVVATRAPVATGFVPAPLKCHDAIVPPRSFSATTFAIPLTSSPFTSSLAARAGDSSAGSDDDEDVASRRRRADRIASALIFTVVPAASLALPALLSAGLFAPLLVAKRAVVYGMAGTIVGVAAARGATEDDASLGRRLEGLTAEILPRSTPPPSPDDTRTEQQREEEDERFRELRALDGVDSTTQSAALPAIVVVSLVLSVLLLRLQDGGGGDASEELGAMASLRDAARDAAPALVGLSNAAVLGLFTRAELDRAVRAWWEPSVTEEGDIEAEDGAGDDAEDSSSPPPLATPLAVALLLAAYLLPPSLAWPARNAASMSLGIAVSRAVQLPRLGPIAAALSVLVVYDVVSVGVMLVELGSATLSSSGGALEGAATDAATSSSASASASAASSAMGAVALSKVGGTSALTGSGGTPTTLWSPGLLEVWLKGRATDLLGLGDAVFPSLLATFAFRFDERRIDAAEEQSEKPPLYFSAAMLGFAAGCFGCEFAPGIESSGLPALLFIVPSMFFAVLGLAAVRGEFKDIWGFDPVANDGDSTE